MCAIKNLLLKTKSLQWKNVPRWHVFLFLILSTMHRGRELQVLPNACVVVFRKKAVFLSLRFPPTALWFVVMAYCLRYSYCYLPPKMLYVITLNESIAFLRHFVEIFHRLLPTLYTKGCNRIKIIKIKSYYIMEKDGIITWGMK